MVKYVIRRIPGAPAIDTSHWLVWRPGMYVQPLAPLRAFARANSLQEALEYVRQDTFAALREFAVYTNQDRIDIVEAVYWWTARRRNDWRQWSTAAGPNNAVQH